MIKTAIELYDFAPTLIGGINGNDSTVTNRRVRHGEMQPRRLRWTCHEQADAAHRPRDVRAYVPHFARLLLRVQRKASRSLHGQQV